MQQRSTIHDDDDDDDDDVLNIFRYDEVLNSQSAQTRTTRRFTRT
jgi:hypothetical protein